MQQNILLIKHGAFGDLIQCDGVFRDIRNYYPEAKISLLTSQGFESLMMRCPHINKVLVDSRAPWWRWGKQIQIFKAIYSHNFDQIIDLQNSDRTAIYRRVLFRKLRWIWRSREIEIVSGLQGLVQQLSYAGIPVINALKPDVSWMADDVSVLLQKNAINKPYIVLIPGCSAKHPQKRWPHYRQLAASLMEEGYEIINIIGPDEQELMSHLLGHTQLKEGENLTWFELAGLLQQAHFIIGNDTGPSHVASCLNKPGLALFGAHTSASRAEITRAQFQVIEVDDLENLSAETVFQRVLENLSPQVV